MGFYIQITDRCTMRCNHCCLSCTDKGSFMKRATFERALEWAVRLESMVTLGGGEPTLHPQLQDFLDLAVRKLERVSYDIGHPAVSIVTNGSNRPVALRLAKLAQKGVIWASVSKDEFHEPIEPDIYAAFEPNPDDKQDHRQINRLGLIVPAGRARRWGNHPFKRCALESVFVGPSGNVYPCGCRTRVLGRVSDAQFPSELWDFVEETQCSREKPATKRPAHFLPAPEIENEAFAESGMAEAS